MVRFLNSGISVYNQYCSFVAGSWPSASGPQSRQEKWSEPLDSKIQSQI